MAIVRNAEARSPLSARLKSLIYLILREIIYACGRDVTEEMLDRSRTLVLAPHPDDETLGCGAAISRLRAAGRSVRVVVVTDGSVSHNSRQISPRQLAEIRAAEAVAACAELGVPAEEMRFLGFTDRQTDADDPLLTERILHEIKEYSPEQIFYPCRIDRHPDHRAVAGAVETLLSNTRASFAAYAYPVWFWRIRDWILPAGLRDRMSLRVVKVRSREHLSTKHSAISRHRSQFENLTGEPGWNVLGQDVSQNAFGRFEIFFEFRR